MGHCPELRDRYMIVTTKAVKKDKDSFLKLFLIKFFIISISISSLKIVLNQEFYKTKDNFINKID